MLYLRIFENSTQGRGAQRQFPAGGTFSWRHCKARSVHFISCSFTDSVVPPLSCSGSGSSLSGMATSSYGSLSSRQASSIKSRILPSRCTSLSIFLQLCSPQFHSAGIGFLPVSWSRDPPRSHTPYVDYSHELVAWQPSKLPKQRGFGYGGFVGRNTKPGA